MPVPGIPERILEKIITQLISIKVQRSLKKATRVFDVQEISQITINLQSKLINYIIDASYYQEQLSEYLLDNKNDLEEQDTEAIANLRQKVEKLETILNDNLRIVCDDIFDLIIKYFTGRSNIDPRVCIKVIHENKIHGIFRHKYNQDLNHETIFTVEENTAFSYICTEGEFYYCLDIPKALANNEYKNARIDERMAKQYYKKHNQFTQDVGNFFTRKADSDWMVCWKDNPRQPESCYKSTLVFPLIMLRNEARPRVQDFFENNLQTRGIIFGFLCLDHHMKKFFNLKEDKAIGCIFADILTIYFAIYSKYSSCSKIFQKANSYLKKAN